MINLAFLQCSEVPILQIMVSIDRSKWANMTKLKIDIAEDCLSFILFLLREKAGYIIFIYINIKDNIMHLPHQPIPRPFYPP